MRRLTIPEVMTMKIFAVDAETDGLYGRTIAIGAVCGDAVFHARIPVDDPKACASAMGYSSSWRPNTHIQSDWVRENVLPVIYPIEETFATTHDLEEAFWRFYRTHATDATVIAHCGAPVEANLFRHCIEVDEERTFQGPLPLHELGTLLLALGEEPSSDDAYVRRHGLALPDGRAHDPLYDAKVTAMIWEHAMRRFTSQ